MSDNFSASFDGVDRDGLRHDAPSSSASHPLHGSPLHLLVQRQVLSAGFARTLAFVPSQIR